ncbi:hypothetical protein CsSME_00048223 [Camellia sinensis var. sinensis]
MEEDLALMADTLDSIQLEDGLDVTEDVSHHCLLRKVLAPKQLNKQSISSILHDAWKARASFSIAPWNDNLFLFSFDDAKDRRWVLNEAPWSIMGHLFILQPLGRGTLVSDMVFTWCPFWIQVHGLPLEKLTKANSETIARKLGCLIRVEAYCEGLLLYRNFLHIRVELDISKPLPRGFYLQSSGQSPGGTQYHWVSLKIEKLFDFCFDSGRIGHYQNVCKFVMREEGQRSSYGLDLRTGIARSTSLPMEHYKKQVDELEDRVRRSLHQLQPHRPASKPVPRREPAFCEMGTTSTILSQEQSGGARSLEQCTIYVAGDVDVRGRGRDNRTTYVPQSMNLGNDIVDSLGSLGAPSQSRLGLQQVGLKAMGSVSSVLGSSISSGPPYFVTEPVDCRLVSGPNSPPPRCFPSPISIKETSPNSRKGFENYSWG